jgi:hypothetical protein
MADDHVCPVHDHVWYGRRSRLPSSRDRLGIHTITSAPPTRSSSGQTITPAEQTITSALVDDHVCLPDDHVCSKDEHVCSPDDEICCEDEDFALEGDLAGAGDAGVGWPRPGAVGPAVIAGAHPRPAAGSRSDGAGHHRGQGFAIAPSCFPL